MNISISGSASQRQPELAYNAQIGAENGLFCPETGPETAIFAGKLHPAGPVGTLTVPHTRELMQGSAIAPDVALANFASFGPGCELHWEDVREALLAEKLERLAEAGSGQAGDRYQSMLKLRKQYQHLEHGGWVLYGHDPGDLSRKVLLCVKPDQPRLDREGKVIKYETRPGTPDKLMLLSVPSRIVQAIAADSGLEAPSDVVADEDGTQGNFWAWVAVEPRLKRYLTEGGKKAASGLSAGRLVIGATGCWNFCPRDGATEIDPKTGDRVRTGKPQLHPDIQGWAWEGCETSVIFDKPKRRSDRAAEVMAATRTAWLLRKAGADVRWAVMPGPEKGLDDWLAAGKTWAALDEHLKQLKAGPVMPRRPRPDVVTGPDVYLSQAVTIPSPEQAKLVCLGANMGSGKTVLIHQAITAHQADGVRILLPMHRVNLGAATAATLQLPWSEEARPGEPLRHLGFGCCFDSLCPESALKVEPDGWRDTILVLDEVAQGLRHLLMASGTAIADRRASVLLTFTRILRSARQVICADAQLPDFVVRVLEALMGCEAYVIDSQRQPFAGAPAVMYPTRKSLQAKLSQLLEVEKPRLWVNTTAQKEGEKNGTVALEQWICKQRPDLKVLRVDSDTQADPEHDAARLTADPAGIAMAYDVIVCSPAVGAGLSVPADVPFDGVVGFSGGTIEPEQFVQAQARVRFHCPRFLYAPEKAPGKALRVGGGDFTAKEVLTHVVQAGSHTIRQLVAAGAALEQANTTGVLLSLWAEFAALSNGQRLAYAATVAGYLEREGFAVDVLPEWFCEDLLLEEIVNAGLKRIAKADQLAYEQDVITAPLPTDEELAQLQERRRLTRDERVKKYRYDLAQQWGLGDRPPTRQLLEAEKDGLNERLMWGWLVQNAEAQQLARKGDLTVAMRQATHGHPWLPDLLLTTVTAKLDAALGLDIPGWLQRTDEFTAEDPKLQQLHATVTSHANGITAVLGASAGKDPHTTLRRLLRVFGYQLKVSRKRVGSADKDNRVTVYQVEPTHLPDGVLSTDLEAVWLQSLETRITAGTGLLSTKFPNKRSKGKSRTPVEAAAVAVGGAD